MAAQARRKTKAKTVAAPAAGPMQERINWSTGEVLDAPSLTARHGAATLSPPLDALLSRTSVASAVLEAMPIAEPVEPFGRWLLMQKGREDWIDLLADSARRDPGFPKDADPDQVRRYLEKRGCSDADVFEQVDDAERVWSSL